MKAGKIQNQIIDVKFKGWRWQAQSKGYAAVI